MSIEEKNLKLFHRIKCMLFHGDSHNFWFQSTKYLKAKSYPERVEGTLA